MATAVGVKLTPAETQFLEQNPEVYELDRLLQQAQACQLLGDSANYSEFHPGRQCYQVYTHLEQLQVGSPNFITSTLDFCLYDLVRKMSELNIVDKLREQGMFLGHVGGYDTLLNKAHERINKDLEEFNYWANRAVNEDDKWNLEGIAKHMKCIELPRKLLEFNDLDGNIQNLRGQIELLERLVTEKFKLTPAPICVEEEQTS